MTLRVLIAAPRPATLTAMRGALTTAGGPEVAVTAVAPPRGL